MAQHLVVEVRFHAGRYHGQEWPPAPMRLFQALVAGAGHRYRGENWPEPVVAALRLLEGLEPPIILAAPSPVVSRHVLSVPNNDEDLAMRDWTAGRPVKAIEEDQRKRRVLKAIPRRYCSAPLRYAWQLPDRISRENADALVVLARLLHTLGLGIDAACATAWITDEAPASASDTRLYRPIRYGAGTPHLRVPAPGSFDSLEARHIARSTRAERGEYVDPEVAHRAVTYATEQALPVPPVRLYRLQGIEGRPWSWPQRDIVTAGAMLRHAVMQAAPAHLVDYASGHAGGPRRLSWVPLPSVGHEHADGRIRRTLVIAPPGDEEPLREATWRLHCRDLQHQSRPVARLIETDEWDGVFSAYLGEARQWETVTPIVLPGHDDHGRKVERLTLKALRDAGYPQDLIEAVWTQKAPFGRHGYRAGEYHAASHMQYSQIHVRVHFRSPVSGPVMAGVGRHYGRGLFSICRHAASAALAG